MAHVESGLLCLDQIIVYGFKIHREFFCFCLFFSFCMGWMRMNKFIISGIYQSRAIRYFLAILILKASCLFFSRKTWYLTSGASSVSGWDCPPLLSERSWSLPCPCFVCVPLSSWPRNTVPRTPPLSKPSPTAPRHHYFYQRFLDLHQRLLVITVHINVS